jgi:protein gp37
MRDGEWIDGSWWDENATWSPFVGCMNVDAGCRFCYVPPTIVLYHTKSNNRSLHATVVKAVMGGENR